MFSILNENLGENFNVENTDVFFQGKLRNLDA